MGMMRIWVIARNVFLEIIRDRVLYLVALYALGMAAATLLLPEVAAGAQDKITLDLGMAGIHVLGLLVAVFVGTGLINQEIEKRTVLVLIAKPVSRGEFIVGKHLGLTAVLAILMALLTAIFFGVLSLNAIAYTPQSLLLAIAFTFLEMALLAAVAMLFGVFTSSLLAMLMTFAVYLMGHLSTDILALGELSENPALQRLTSGLYLVLPDLERLNLRNQAVYGLNLFPGPGELVAHGLYALLYIALLLTLTGVIFTRRQF